jgi:cell division protein FtsW (lipid II flippase)
MIAWATSLAVLFLEKDLGASLLYFAVFVVMLWIASGRPMFLIVGLALFVVGAWIGYLALSHVQLRVDLLAERARSRQGLPAGVRAARAGVVRHGIGRHRRHRAGHGIADADPVRSDRLHLRGDR